MIPISWGLPGAVLVTISLACATALLAGRNSMSMLLSSPLLRTPLKAAHRNREPEGAAGNETSTFTPVGFFIDNVRVRTVPRGTEPKLISSGLNSSLAGGSPGGGNPP